MRNSSKRDITPAGVHYDTYEEAAVKFNVGTFTIKAWVDCGYLKSITIYGNHYIPENEELNHVITTAKGGNS